MLHIASGMFHNPGSYFSLPGDSVSGDGPHRETRYADRWEVHTACHVSLFDWENEWKPEGHNGYPLKGHAANSIFFDPLVLTPTTATTLR